MIYDPDRNAFRADGPPCVLPHVMWHITDVCPLRCPYCFAPKTEQTMQPQAIDGALAVLQKLGVQKIDVGGGEPLIYPHLRALLKKIRAHGIYCTLTTSGVGRKENFDALPSLAKHLTRLIVSLDAYADAHDRLRGNCNAWNSVNDIVRRLDPATRRKKLRINTVATGSLEFEASFRQLGNWVAHSGVREWCLIQPHPANQKDTYGNYELSDERFEEVVEQARGMVDSDIEVTVRRPSLYADYWVLHPSGLLQKHSHTAVDGVGVDLATHDMENIKNVILTSGASAPLEKK
ncbi:radical SAM protein [Pseudomonas sp. NPDC089401]|uniref:radical SAM protein n=1 Tax=Pseudomonas sp. NPDC089401 TaxID=3364462 RepID=UPI0038215284